MPSHATSLTMNGVTCMHAQWLKDPVLATFLSLYNEISLNIAYMIWFGFVAWPIKRKCGSGSLVAGMLIDILYHMVLPGNATSDALERTINLVLGGCFWHHKDLSEKNKSCCNRAGCNQWTSRIVGWKNFNTYIWSFGNYIQNPFHWYNPGHWSIHAAMINLNNFW